MLLDVCLGTRTSWKILLVLAEAPGKGISRKEIYALTKLGNKVLSRFLLMLQKFEIITASKMGKTNYYKLNLSSPFVEKILELAALEKKQLNNPDFIALNILREFTYELTNIDLDNIHNVFLFGSYAKRTYGKGSDIDVAIVLKEKRPDDELLITEIIDKLAKRFKKEIQPHYYTITEFEQHDTLSEEIVKDGIQLM